MPNSSCYFTASKWSITTDESGTPIIDLYGNGVLLWFEVDEFDAVVQRATQMKVEMVRPKHRNPPPGKEGGPNHWECWMKDPDGYVVVVASPDGSADGTWQPDQA